jgi:hypothetical protein
MQGVIRESGEDRGYFGNRAGDETGRAGRRPPCSILVLTFVRLWAVWQGPGCEWIGLVIVALIVAVWRERHSAKDLSCLCRADGDEMADGVVAIVIAVACW